MAILFAAPFFRATDLVNAPIPGAFLGFYATTTSALQPIWADAPLTIELQNPLQSDGNGVFPAIWLDDALPPYKYVLYAPDVNDPTIPGAVLRTGDPYTAPLNISGLIDQLAPLINVKTPAEITLNLTIVNYLQLPGFVDRYGINTVPGTTNMGNALQNAINQCLLPGGSPARFNAGVYALVTLPNLGTISTNYIRLEICGASNYGTQIVNNAPANSGPCFDCSGYSGGYIHDLVLSGNTAHKNDGIHINHAGSGTQTQAWQISRIVSFMPGYGILLADTNTNSIDAFQHWPGSGGTYMQVSQAVTLTDVNHGIYMTGGFVHNVMISNSEVVPGANFATGQCGIKLDCSASNGVSLVNILCQTRSGLNTETGIDIASAGSVQALTMQGIYHEGTAIKLTNVSNSNIKSITDGGSGGSLILGPGTRENKFDGVNVAVMSLASSSDYGNSFEGVTVRGADAWSSSIAYSIGRMVTNSSITYTCIVANTNNAPPNATFWTASSSFTDGSDGANLSTQPNSWRGCSLPVVGPIAPRGQKWRVLLAYSASMAPDSYAANIFEIRVTNNSTFDIASPTHPYNGQEVEYVIRNEVGGAMAAAPTIAGAAIPGWTSPANGFHRCIIQYYSSDFSSWKYKHVGTTDLPN